jgi:hypothetical protein
VPSVPRGDMQVLLTAPVARPWNPSVHAGLRLDGGRVEVAGGAAVLPADRRRKERKKSAILKHRACIVVCPQYPSKSPDDFAHYQLLVREIARH